MRFRPSDADLLAGQREGDLMLAKQNATQENDLARFMGAYGSPADPEYMRQMAEMRARAEAFGKLKMDARLEDAQIRSRIHKEKLSEFMREWKEAQKARRNQMWGSIIGSAAQLGSNIYGVASQPSPQDPNPNLRTQYGGQGEYGEMQQIPEWFLARR